jgi:hypothetical protein
LEYISHEKIKLFLLRFVVGISLLASQAYAQWSFVGFVTGVGTFPSISVYGPNDVVTAGACCGTPAAYINQLTAALTLLTLQVQALH